ncbi:MAG TPA: NrfD/PsrC family molybdoenzyme membrane anchor subunit [Terriglobia bacterium]|nr:NrfD/PsrC family molybdoenzyme membrane anchor subunit [Terriglobia bacterium]
MRHNEAREPGQTTPWQKVGDDVLSPLWRGGPVYWLLLGLSFALVVAGAWLWNRQIDLGLGVAGITRPAGWGVYIATFVFWVGITHSGTLMSAIFYLFGVPWRAAISRLAEATTLLALLTAAFFPLIHLGRPWLAFWLIPYPNQRELWVNFRSPLIWDVFAVGTYFTISLLFGFIGTLPDLAAARDRSSGWKKSVYGFFSFRWRGTGTQWFHFRAAYLLLAALVIPLAISVHSVVSWDFAMGIVPGWHSTIFAPYFVAGAIFSGLAMITLLVILLRRAYRLERYITPEHFDKLGQLLLLMSLIMSYVYAVEFFLGWYGGDPVERASLYYRAFGAYRELFWTMLVCNSVAPLLLFSGRLRRNPRVQFCLAVLILTGMYLERILIVPVSLTHEYAPYVWGLYRPTIYEYGILAASFGFFFFCFLVFIKLVPAIPMYEVRELAHAQPPQAAAEVAR